MKFMKLLVPFFAVNIAFALPYAAKNLPKDIKLIEGDIAVSKYEIIEKAATDYKAKNWNNGIVPYTIAPRFANDSRLKSSIARGMKVLSDKTNLRFKKRTYEKDYLEFTSAYDGCWSYVGKQGGKQTLNLARGCQYTYIVAHEILHAAGTQHEQSRPDRDKYVTIHWNNMNKSVWNNFQKVFSARHGAYDYRSVMHYGSYDFSTNGRPTITKKNGTTFKSNRSSLTRGDIAGINSKYPRSNGPSPVVVGFDAKKVNLGLSTSYRRRDKRYGYHLNIIAENNMLNMIKSVKYDLLWSTIKARTVSSINDNFSHTFFSKRKSYSISVTINLVNGKSIKKKYKIRGRR